MIDDKIKEPQDVQPSAPPPLTTKEKLRAFWARVQCSSLLRRHHFRARTRRRMEGFGTDAGVSTQKTPKESLACHLVAW